MSKLIAFWVALAALMVCSPSLAQEKLEFTITIKDHRFDPQELKVPASKKIKLIIQNQDPTPEEFESFDLNREKVIAGKAEAIIFIGPLKSGTYKYFGEFHPQSAQGKIIVE